MRWSIEDFVYDASDGAVTTFAVVAGVFGASLSLAIILILGFANLFADGISMSIGSYLSTKTRSEVIEKERKREEWEIDNMENEEKNEIREIYEKKGFKDDILEDIVRIITSRRKVWLDTMMKEELGLIDDHKNPLETAITTFVAFNVIGIIPLLPFIFLYISGFNTLSTSSAFLYSIIFTAVAFFVIGIIKGKIVNKSIISSGFSTLSVGAIAVVTAYLVGFLLSRLVK
jgi:VIT1/CCC1 family predicted Fe2+/Mn2+ transporter